MTKRSPWHIHQLFVHQILPSVLPVQEADKKLPELLDVDGDARLAGALGGTRLAEMIEDGPELRLDFSQLARSNGVSLPLCSPEQIHDSRPSRVDSITYCFY